MTWYVNIECIYLKTLMMAQNDMPKHLYILIKLTKGKIKERQKEGQKLTGRQGIRLKQILDDLKETRGYWKLKQEALDRIVCRTRFGRNCEQVARQNAE